MRQKPVRKWVAVVGVGVAIAGAFGLGLGLPAASAVDFSSSEGYGNGNLAGQPAASPQWAVVGTAGGFLVTSSSGGSVALQANQASTQYAVWQTPLHFGQTPTATASLDFSFTQSAPTAGTAVIVGLPYFYNSASGFTNVRAFFARAGSADQYRIGFYQGNGSPAVSLSLNVAGSAIGLGSSGGDNTSDALRLSFTLNRGAVAGGWTGSVQLTNVTTGAAAGSLSIPAFSTSSAFFNDASLFSAISTEAVQNAAIASLNVAAWTPGGGTVPPVLPGMTLTFNDEFEGTAVDTAKWNAGGGGLPINSELQAYMPDAFEVAGGKLRIRSDRRSFFGKNYTSGRLDTVNIFAQTYGYFEMRAKMPEGRGLWPAFWLLPQDNSWPPEIDIVEFLGEDPLTVHQTMHWRDPALVTPSNPSGKTASGVSVSGPDFSYDYHTYAASWRPGLIIFYVDGVEYHRLTSFVPTVPMYMILNTAVGGTWPVDPDFTTPFPSYFEIDYVRAYQHNDLGPQAPLPVTVGKTTVTPQTVSPGETVTFASSVVAGNASLSSATVHLYVRNFQAGTQYADIPVILSGPIPQNTSRPFTATYTVPADMAPGIYTVKTQVSAPGVTGNAVGNVASIIVGSPLPPFPEPPPPVVPAPAAINLSSLTFGNVSGQGAATMTITGGGAGIRLQGNGWKIAPFNYTVTAKTVLEFDISAGTQGEIYGIGFLPSASSDLNIYSFQIVGNQTLGRQHYNTYSVVTGGVKHYKIPLGGFYTGSTTQLIFINDFDSGSANGDVTFSNIKIYEGP